MTNLADTLLVADVLARERPVLPTAAQWEAMEEQIAMNLERVTRPLDDDELNRDTYLPRYCKGKRWTLIPPYDGFPLVIIYDPLVGANEL